MRYCYFFLFLLFSFSLSAQTEQIHKINFDYDQYILDEAAKESLDAIAQSCLSALQYEIELKGHTDSDGSDSYNVQLSIDRSEAVQEYLVSAGLEASNIQLENYGEKLPEVDNVNEENKSKNRRVELILSYTPISSTAELFEHLGKQEMQSFSCSNSKDQYISCKDGSIIQIPEGAFRFRDGRLLGDEHYTLNVDEAIKASSMIKHRLNTAHEDGALKTGGMIRLEAIAENGEELLLVEGKAIAVSIPTAEADPSMTLWKGDRRSDELMNWEGLPQPVNLLDEAPLDHTSLEFPEELLSQLSKYDVEIPEYPGKLREVKFPALLEKPEPLTPFMQKPFKPGKPERRIAKRPQNIFERISFNQEEAQAEYDKRYEERLASYNERMVKYEDALIAYAKNQKQYKAEMAIIDKQFEIDKELNFQERMTAIEAYMETCYAYEVASLFSQKIKSFHKDLNRETLEQKLFPNSERVAVTTFTFNVSLKSLELFARGKTLPYGESADLHDYYREAMHRLYLFEKEIGYQTDWETMKKTYADYRHKNTLELQNKNAETMAALGEQIKYYNFEITDPEFFWCNIDTPTPWGTDLIVFNNSRFSELFTFRPKQKVVNYFPNQMRKQGLYRTDQPVEYLSFRYGEGIELATGQFNARRGKKIDLEYRTATLQEIEQALARLDG